jgi:hypothetical protein
MDTMETRVSPSRAAVAQGEFDSYDFGEGLIVEGADGWEHLSPGREWTRRVYFEGPDNLSCAGFFTVVFTDPYGTEVAEAYGFVEGAPVGRRTIPSVQPCPNQAHLDLQALIREAAVPGGVGPHEFSRPGGWLERAKAVLARIDGQRVHGQRIDGEEA